MASPHPLESPTNHIDSATLATPPAERQLRSIHTPTPSSFPKSRYYTGPPSPTSSPYNTPPPPNPQTLIGHVPPRSIIRIERDYTHSASHVPQFYSAFPLELDKRVSPTECTEVVNDVNEMLVKANSPLWAGLDNAAAVLSLWVWPLVGGSHYERVSRRAPSDPSSL